MKCFVCLLIALSLALPITGAPALARFKHAKAQTENSADASGKKQSQTGAGQGQAASNSGSQKNGQGGGSDTQPDTADSATSILDNMLKGNPPPPPRDDSSAAGKQDQPADTTGAAATKQDQPADTTTSAQPASKQDQRLDLTPVPKTPTTLKGQAEEDANAPTLTGRAEAPLLKGSATLAGGKGELEDPDAADQELLVAWDRWRNRLLRAIQLGAQQKANDPEAEEENARPRYDPMTGTIMPRIPYGIECTFSCQVTSTGQIKNLYIVRASGYPPYDRTILRAVRDLEGTSILVFPAGSHRTIVTQAAAIKTSPREQGFNYYHFGDVEHVRQ
jgi:hypothetical protein